VDVLVVALTWLSIILFVALTVHDTGVQSTASAAAADQSSSSYISGYAQSAACHNVWRCVNALLLILVLIVVRIAAPCFGYLPYY